MSIQLRPPSREQLTEQETDALFYDEAPQAEQEAIEAAERLKVAMQGFVDKLQKEVDRRISLKQPIEERWLEDLRQYYGFYDPAVLAKLKEAEASQLFINVTRPKTNTASAKLYDMLFPTDDRNWGIQPTPVPELSQAIEEGDAQAKETVDQANRLLSEGRQQEADALVSQASQPAQAAIAARKAMDAANRSARAMELEIDDQFRESCYSIESRDAIEDGCILGTGIMKGPVAPIRQQGRWAIIDGQTVWSTDQVKKPAYYRVDPWHFFPDPEANCLSKGEGTFERHPMNASQLRRLAKAPGFDREAIGRLLKLKAKHAAPYFYNALRDITGVQQTSGDETYHVFEYYGPVTAGDLRTIAESIGKEDMASDYEDSDELDEIQMCIWFCQGEILKFVEHSLDSGEPIYSVWCWQKDPTSVFGHGVPRTMRDSQKALNAAWRMMMDNAGLATGPQIFMAQNSIEPADGDWTLKPRKLWFITKPLQPGERAIDFVEIPTRQPELMAIINLVRAMIDDETGINQLAQGEQGAGVTKTAQGMAILMNSTNVVFRRVVRNWDDDMTTPNVRRAYHWNMQFNPKNNIKGDFEVDARGSSVLLVRELQANNLMNLTMQAAGHPVIGPITKIPELYRKAVQANQIPVDEVIMTDDEIEKMAAEQAAQPPAPDPEMMKLEIQREIATQELQVKEKIAHMELQAKMVGLAEARNMKVDEIAAELQKAQITAASKERGMAVEVAMRERTGKSAGGAI